MGVKTPQINACVGFYVGTVIQHLPHGQLKVFIPQIYPEEWKDKPEMLPICMQVTPQFGGSNAGNGIFSYPNIGSTVICGFANNDQNYPFTFGSFLGGENAFGQYEWIKSPEEKISERHLVTSGKSHVEFYENGKISSVVYQPIRTDAKVQYNNSYQAQKADDKVTSREICQKVDSEELSNINCQTVLDNYFNNGEISSSTHYFNPTNIISVQILSAEQTTILQTYNGEERNDHREIMNNAGHNTMDDVSSYSLTFTQNTTCIPDQTTEQIVNIDKLDNNVEHIKNIECDNQLNMNTNTLSSYNYAFYNNKTKQTIISSDTLTNDASNRLFQNKDGNYGFGYDYKFTEKYLFTEPLKKDLVTKDYKETQKSSMSKNENMVIDTSTQMNSKLNEVNWRIKLQKHDNKHSSIDSTTMDPEKEMLTKVEWHDDDLKWIGEIPFTPLEIHNKYDNVNEIKIGSNPKADITMKSHAKWKKEIGPAGNTTETKYNTQCNLDMKASDGSISIAITNNDTHQSCSFTMDNKGNMSIFASETISIYSPVISMTGSVLRQNFSSITTTGSTVNITGSNGDVKIKNVSLLNHLHQEMQSGDVVVPGPTKTATTSN